MRRLTAQQRSGLYLLALVVLCAGAAWSISLAAKLPSREQFNVVSWELRHLPNKWLYLTGRQFRGRMPLAEEDERLERYLELTLRIDLVAADGSQQDELARL